MDPKFSCFFRAITGGLSSSYLYFNLWLLESFTKCGPRTWINSLPWDLLIHADSPAHPHVLKQKLWSRAQQSCFTKPCSRDAGDAKVRATAHLSSAQDHSNAVYQYPLLNTNKPKPMIKIFLLSKVPSSYHCFSPLPKASVALSPFLH